MTRPTAPLRLLQLSDLHLPSIEAPGLDWSRETRHIDTFASLEQILTHVRTTHQEYDAVVVSGDIAQEPSEQTYRRFLALMHDLHKPVICTPGNHDDSDLLRRIVAQDRVNCALVSAIAGWKIINLYSAVSGAVHGEISATTLKRLQTQLSSDDPSPVVVITHHHPAPCGSPWLDRINLVNGDQLIEVLTRHVNVRALIHGHIHQTRIERRERVYVISGPSTCVQFKPKSDQFSFDKPGPGYQIISLTSSGQCDCATSYLDPSVYLDCAAQA